MLIKISRETTKRSKTGLIISKLNEQGEKEIKSIQKGKKEKRRNKMALPKKKKKSQNYNGRKKNHIQTSVITLKHNGTK